MSDGVKAGFMTLIKTFIVASVGQLLAYGVGVFEITAGQWKAVAASGIAAVLMWVYNWANTNDTRYGRGSG
jgi:hypothetical protein